MKWTAQAEQAIKKVPFFVRKKVRAKVEKEALDMGKSVVTITEVKAAQNRFLNQMEKEIQGFQVDACFGSNGCPNRILNSENLQKDIETLLQKEDMLGFLKDCVKGGLKFHHEFRVTLADCPNACSQPQIKDVGIIGARAPIIQSLQCSQCRQCIDICQENAITIDDDMKRPIIDFNQCVRCGKCISVCPTGTITASRTGFRILIGGKLGRHPRLAEELPGLFSEAEVIDILKYCIIFYKQQSRNGCRFGELLEKHPAFIKELIRSQ